MCFYVLAVSDWWGPWGCHKWHKLIFSLITLRSPLLPIQHPLAITEGRQHCYLASSQSALSLAPWEVRSTFTGTLMSGRGLVGGGWWGPASWAVPTGSSLEEGFRLTIPHGSWENKKWKLKPPPIASASASAPTITASVIHRHCSLGAAYIHQSLKWRVAFQCFVASLTSSLPSSPSPLPDDDFTLLLSLTFSTPRLRRCLINGVRWTLHEREVSIKIQLQNSSSWGKWNEISVEYIDHWIQGPLNLAQWRPWVALPRVVTVEWWGEDLSPVGLRQV